MLSSVILTLLPGNEIQRKWTNIRDTFRKELKLQKVTSGQGARKRGKCIYFDQLLLLLPIMQRDTSSNITPTSVNECEPQDMTGHEMGESSHAKNATYYKQQKKRLKGNFLVYVIHLPSANNINNNLYHVLPLPIQIKNT